MQAYEVCPNCGEYVHRLIEFTGWCDLCSKNHLEGSHDRCATCGRVRKLDSHSACSHCREDDFIRRHKRRYKKLRKIGYSRTKAVRVIHEEVRPSCLCCGEPIPLSKAGSVFCKKNVECRRVRRRYYTLRTKKVPNALRKVLEELRTTTNAVAVTHESSTQS